MFLICLSFMAYLIVHMVGSGQFDQIQTIWSDLDNLIGSGQKVRIRADPDPQLCFQGIIIVFRAPLLRENVKISSTVYKVQKVLLLTTRIVSNTGSLIKSVFCNILVDFFQVGSRERFATGQTYHLRASAQHQPASTAHSSRWGGP